MELKFKIGDIVYTLNKTESGHVLQECVIAAIHIFALDTPVIPGANNRIEISYGVNFEGHSNFVHRHENEIWKTPQEFAKILPVIKINGQP